MAAIPRCGFKHMLLRHTSLRRLCKLPINKTDPANSLDTTVPTPTRQRCPRCTWVFKWWVDVHWEVYPLLQMPVISGPLTVDLKEATRSTCNFVCWIDLASTGGVSQSRGQVYPWLPATKGEVAGEIFPRYQWCHWKEMRDNEYLTCSFQWCSWL